MAQKAYILRLEIATRVVVEDSGNEDDVLE